MIKLVLMLEALIQWIKLIRKSFHLDQAFICLIDNLVRGFFKSVITHPQLNLDICLAAAKSYITEREGRQNIL